MRTLQRDRRHRGAGGRGGELYCLQKLRIEPRRELQEGREALALDFLVRTARGRRNRDPNAHRRIFHGRREFLAHLLSLGHPQGLGNELEQLFPAHINGA